jgi:hypothetical protein
VLAGAQATTLAATSPPPATAAVRRKPRRLSGLASVLDVGEGRSGAIVVSMPGMVRPADRGRK